MMVNHKIIQKMQSITPFAFSKGNRLIKIRINSVNQEEYAQKKE